MHISIADAALKGSVRPFGGHKGFGLALITQILAGALVNAATILLVPWSTPLQSRLPAKTTAYSLLR